MSAASSSNPTPLQQVTLSQDDFENPSQFVSVLNANLTNLFQSVNALSGYAGPIKLGNHVDLGGHRISNVGDAVSDSDVVSQSFANSKYSAGVIQPQLEALGKSIMQTYRQLSNPNQREMTSSFLNAILNTSPTSNTSIVTASSPVGGTVNVNVSGGLHQLVDGSVVPYASRTDTLTLPTSWGILTLVRTGGVVTATTTSINSLSPGDSFAVLGATDPSFDGNFVVVSIVTPGSVFTYSQPGGNATSATGGTISLGGVYYYVRNYGQNQLALVGGFSSDTWSNRRQASGDGSTIIGVVVINGSGLDTLNSAAGATAPQSGTNIPVIRRL
jgi:hypothetical protein